jgi:serine/threonine-protein kinase HipA
MAELRYANVYLHGVFAGILREQPDGSFTFTYDGGYLESGGAAIAHTLPPQFAPIATRAGLHTYFDNLVAEGWLANAQARALAIRGNDRFGRLLAFGEDCIGAVSVRDPRPSIEPKLDAGTPEEIAALASRASISGVQPKMLAMRDGRGYRPACAHESSTHIAKLPSGRLPGIVELEYLTTLAATRLLEDDRIVELEIADVAGISRPSLLVRRFDRFGGGKIPFEEFNQLLDRPSEAKYEGSYGEMAAFLSANPRADQRDVDRLFRRILACILVGNNDAHMKNFGLLFQGGRMRLAPVYDFVAGVLYSDFDPQLALRIGEGPNPRSFGGMGPGHVEALAKSFGLGRGALMDAVRDLGGRVDAAAAAVLETPHGKPTQKKKLAQYLRKRWNGTFSSIGSSIGKK